MFKPGDPVPTRKNWPLLDSGRGGGGASQGIGGDTATMSNSNVSSRVAAPSGVGERWTLQCIDSPGRPFPLQHPRVATAMLSQVNYTQDFVANFCFWANTSGVSGASGHPTDRTYSVVRIVPWNIRGAWNITYPVAGPTATATTAHTLTAPHGSRTTVSPIGRAQDHRVEVRPPSGITQAVAWDGRS